jgi:plasmid maintenance system killer protein
MKIKPLREDLTSYLRARNLETKFNKCKSLFEINPFYPSLNTEILEPKQRLIYSFRLDKKYRALFIYTDKEEVEIIAITNHYRQ